MSTRYAAALVGVVLLFAAVAYGVTSWAVQPVEPTSPTSLTSCADTVASGTGWLSCDAQEEARDRRAELYLDEVRTYANAQSVDDQWLLDFAHTVCDGLDDWADGDGRYVAEVVVDQYGSDPDLALLAVGAAARYQCPEHAPSTWE